MRSLISLYKESLKPSETEEWVNSWLFRPLSFVLFVYPLRKTRVTPNMLTLLSLLFGLASGITLWIEAYLPAFVFILIMIFLDCSDGQLARLTKKTSVLGKTLDVIADAVSFVVIFLAANVVLYRTNGSPLVFLYFPAAYLSVAVAIMFYDRFKNQFILYVHENYHEKAEPLDRLRERYRQARGIRRLLGGGYYLFHLIEAKVTVLGSLSDTVKYEELFGRNRVTPSDDLRNRFRRNFKLPLRLYTFLGSGTRLFLIEILILLRRGDLVLPLVILSAWTFIVIGTIVQNVCFSNFRTGSVSNGT